jgi:glucosamine--fructose-6-phosphate aminotransferase (isomerizing)
MCGIIGYTGDKNAYDFLIDGLKRLEYRGYDSAGVAIVGSGIKVIKDIGFVDELLQHGSLPGKSGIAHTRWATHGGVTRANAHPHTDCKEEIAVVHNGIIENFSDLKEKLLEQGHEFKSETDSEVIAHLVEGESDVLKGVFKAANMLKGSFAFLVLYKDRIIACRKDSPLVVGIGDQGNFLASDVPAFIKHTKDVVYLDNYDVAVIEREGVKFYDAMSGKEIQKKVERIDWDISSAEKGGHPHFMIKEIGAQKDTIRRAIEQNSAEINHVAQMINDAKGVFFVACGTSYHSCLCASYIFSKIAKKHVNVVIGSEFPHFEHFINKDTLVISVSQSGETADVLEAVGKAKERGAKILSIVNVMGSSLMRTSDKSLLLNAGPEICVLATKSYTSQLSLLLLIAYATVDKLDEGKEELKKVSDRVGDILDNAEYLEHLADYLKEKNHIFLIGRGISYATALESALKLKEVSYIHAEGFAGGELKHGTLALIEEGTPCIVFVPNGDQEIISNAHEIKARGGYIIGVSPQRHDVFDFFIPTPISDEAHPVHMVVPIQILAYYLAVKRGCNPDKPRNLAKSVTVK